jgi:hypothetical protein
MTELMTGAFIGFVLACGIAAVGFVFVRRMRAGKGKDLKTTVFSSIEDIRAIGELSAFKVVTKEIVTAKDHWAGAFGKKYLGWLISTKKMAMIFEFDIDFRYNLRDPEFQIVPEGERKYRIKMPLCNYEIHIRDINFYDEQRARFMPWLLPDLLTAVFGAGYDEEDRNRLKEEAKEQAYALAQDLVRKLRSEVQNSARQTIETLSRGFGAEKIFFDFKDREPEKVKVEYAVNGQ